MLTVDVAVCIADVDFSEFHQQVNASTVGGPQFRVTLLAIMDIAGKDGATLAVSLALQSLKKGAVLGRHIFPHFL